MLIVIVSVLLGLVWSDVPIILTQPVNITVSPGRSAEFYCKAEGSPTPTVTFTAENYLSEALGINAKRGAAESSTVSTRKSFLAVTEADEGWYVCIVANAQGVVTSRAYLHVEDLCKDMKCPRRQKCFTNETLGTAECHCEECTDIKYNPVCGTDCKSYFNPCSMKQESCQQGKYIGTMSKGQCPLVVPLTLSVGSTDRVIELAESMTLTCEVEGTPSPASVRWMKKTKKGVFRAISYEGEFIIQHARKSTAGEYICVAKHCGNKKVMSEVVTVTVESNISDDPVPLLPTCRVFGDPHIHTFDGFHFDYQGACDFVLAMDCVNVSWMLIGQLMPCGDGVSCLESMTLYYGAANPLMITRGWIVGQGGDKMRVKKNEDAMIGEMTVRYTGLGLKVSLPNGVRVSWDGLWSVEVTVPKGMKTCGLCGDNDGNKENDIQASRYTIPTNTPITFADSWKMDSTGWCIKSADPVPTVDKCGDKIDNATARCTSIIENALFEKCIATLGKDFYKSACVVDVCLTEIPRFNMAIECAVANTLVQHCENAGFPVDKNWPSVLGCPKKRKIEEEIYNAGCPLIGDPPFLDAKKK